MGLYIKLDPDVKSRLIGKVRFTVDEDDENKMPEILANRLINEAEGQVELDLSPRYAAPFQTDAGTAFKNLPERPTREVLRTLCELQAVVRILETDFGKGSVADADKYAKSLKDRYTEIVNRLLERRKDGGNDSSGWKYPPLTSLMLNYQNVAADDGFMGSVWVSGNSNGDYPTRQVNDPSVNSWTGDDDWGQ